MGLDGSKRTERWIRKDYVRVLKIFGSYKVFISKANGSGAFGETLSAPIIAEPGIGQAQTFMSIGNAKVNKKLSQ